ncbi:MFS transporter [Actinoplanes sp. NPDC051343]|uniref:MFS transporter n=1 Tax=Actinoplanes sp. NPDC051343 TaxID=3363906 RepID=UPI003790F653
MASLDTLVVSTALPAVRADLHASTPDLQWVLNAYTLPFAAFLLTAASLGDRLGRRRLFLAGIALFTVASAACALSTTAWQLNEARAVQGLGGAAIVPLSLTLLSHSVPEKARTLAVGIWGGIYGLGVALGPLVGGAVVDHLHWHYIFWLNVPIGAVAVVVVAVVLPESRGESRRLDPWGVLLSASGLLLTIWGVVSGPDAGWTAPRVLAELIGGGLLLVGFVVWQGRNRTPMLPLFLFKSREFSLANAVTLTFNAGLAVAIFLQTQFFQVAQGYSPLEAGVRSLPWTAMPIVVAPLAGHFGDRIGPRKLIAAGQVLFALALVLFAWNSRTDAAYLNLVGPELIAGIGTSLTIAPISSLALASVPAQGRGIAAGVNNTIRQAGIAAGVAVAASIFSTFGSYASPQSFVDGAKPGIYIGGLIVAAGSLAAILLPGAKARDSAA